MQQTVFRRQRGFGLVEILISILVLSFGLVALAVFQGDILQAGGEIKARNEALALGDEKLEDLRNLISEAQYSAVTSGSDSITGKNATFTRAWTVAADGTLPFVDVSVAVTWSDADGNSQSVVVDSALTFQSPRFSAAQAGLGQTGNTIPEPSGGTLYPDETIDVDDGPPQDTVKLSDEEWIWYDGDADKTYLFEDDGTVVLRVDGEGFIRLTGDIVLDSSARTDPADLGVEVAPLTSDAGVCKTGAPVDSDSDGSFDTMEYRCYVGTTWYGNSGVAVGDLQDSVCPPERFYPPTVSSHPGVAPITDQTDVDGAAIPADVLSQISGEDFRLVRLTGQDTCSSITDDGDPSTISVSGDIVLPDGISYSPTLAEVRATPDVLCSIGDPADGLVPFTCPVASTGDAWSGSIWLVFSQPGVDLCGDQRLYAGEITVDTGGFDFTLASAGACGANPGVYTYSIFGEITQSRTGSGVVDEVEVSVTGGVCILNTVSTNKKSGAYRCVVEGDANESVTITATIDRQDAAISTNGSSTLNLVYPTINYSNGPTFDVVDGGI
jgi:Tfp pilus assembly protein PilV